MKLLVRAGLAGLALAGLGCAETLGPAEAPKVWAQSGPWSVTPHVPIETKHKALFQINKKIGVNTKRFDVLVGPDPAGGASAVAVGSFDADGPRWNLANGWAFLIGQWPALRIKRVDGGSDGSKIAGLATPTADAVYFFEGSGKAWGDVYTSDSYTINDGNWTGEKEELKNGAGALIGYRYLLPVDKYLTVTEIDMAAGKVFFVAGPAAIDHGSAFVVHVTDAAEAAPFRMGLD